LRLAEFIQANRETIAKEWVSFARSCLPAAAGLSDQALRDHLEEILAAIVNNMGSLQTREEQAEKSKGRRPEKGIDLAARAHAGLRLRASFGLNEAVAEFRALRASILRLWQDSATGTDPNDWSDLTRFNEAIDQTLTESISWYSLELERYRDQFLAVLGHDLRNPLGAIVTAASLLIKTGDPEERHSRIAAGILHSAMRMSRMVNDLLDLTRSRLGEGIPVKPAPMNLEAVCQQALAELEAFHPDRDLRFEPSGDLHGEWDSDRLVQVVSNLAANALQHGDEAAPVLISARAEGEQVVLAVHNEGTPIPPESMGSIFEPMVRAERSEPAQPSASLGLGLYIVREIVAAHQGAITVTSSMKQGTTFTVRLPRHSRPDERPSRAPR
jgi:signal transduction histidine kinase